MSDASYRKDRIERILKELEYEVNRGIVEREIDEQIGFRFTVPISNSIPGGIVHCEFRTRPMPRQSWNIDDQEPRLKLVINGETS